MSWSLAIRNGDLALGNASLATVGGADKMIQDLRCAILEHMGTDDAHPTFGSLLDGGIDANGLMVPSVIGSNDWSAIGLLVESELNRIIYEYQTKQLSRAQQDQVIYGKQTITADEVVTGVSGVTMVQSQDKLLVNILLQTLGGSQTALQIPISAEGLLTN